MLVKAINNHNKRETIFSFLAVNKTKTEPGKKILAPKSYQTIITGTAPLSINATN